MMYPEPGFSYSAQWDTAERAENQLVITAPAQIVELPPSHPLPSRNDFITRRIRNKITHEHGPLFMLSSDHFRDFGDSAQAVFIEDPSKEMEKTRTNHANDLWFGQLVVSDRDNRESVELVALKQCKSTARLVNEFCATQYLNSLDNPYGGPLSFTPLGFFKDEANGSNVLITRYEHSVLSYDTVLKDKNYSPSEHELARVLGDIAFTLGFMHAYGVADGDAQPKNFSRDSIKPRKHDLEFAHKPLERGGTMDPLETRHMMDEDIITVLEDVPAELTDAYFAPRYLEEIHRDAAKVAPIVGFMPTHAEIVNLSNKKPSS